MRWELFAPVLMFAFTTAVVAQQTIKWKKDHIYNGPGGKEIAVIMPAPNDQTLPTAPGNLTCYNVTSTSVEVSWSAASDSGGSALAGYKVYRQRGTEASLPVGTVGTGTASFLDQPLTPASYTYTVRSFDNAQNHSGPSNSVTVTTGGSCSGSSGYQFYRQITINASQVPSTQADFPVLVRGTYAYLATVTNNGKVQSQTGIDIKFTSDAAGNNLLAYEQEKYVALTGEIAYWVKLPSLSNGTSFYIFYGNANAADQSNKTAVWDSNFKGVWHLTESHSPAAGNYKDSTSSPANGTLTDGNANSSSGTGAISNNVNFNGDADYIDAGNPAKLQITSAITLSAWVNLANYSATVNRIAGKFGASGARGYELSLDDWTASNYNNLAYYASPDGTAMPGRYQSSSFPTSTWVLVHAVYNASAQTVVLYRDGQSISTTLDGTIPSSIYNPSANFRIGARANGAGPFHGNIDEVRVSNTARSADWIRTEHNNQVSGSGFCTVGNEQTTGGGGGGGGYGGYSYRRQITINSGQVPSTQSNFAVSVSGTYSYLATVANDGKVQSSTGVDIKFASDAAGTNVLAYEQEKYVATTGEIGYWVKLPSVADGSGFYMFYGNASASDLSNKTAVWDSNFKGVWHLGNGTTLSATDSTSNGNNGSVTAATAATGQVDGGASFNGTSAWVNAPNIAAISGASQVTVALWGKRTAAGDLVLMLQGGLPSNIVGLEVWSDGYLYAEPSSGSTSYGYYATNDTNWHHWVMVFDGTQTGNANRLKVYDNGIQQTLAFAGTVATTTGSSTANLAIGRNTPAGSGYTKGTMDEVRVSNIARSGDWIRTEYNNQSAPGSFYAVGAEQ